MTGGALPADQADQTDVKEPEMVARVAAREAPESWSWVEQVSAAADDDDDADDDADDNDDDNDDDDDDDDVTKDGYSMNK